MYCYTLHVSCEINLTILFYKECNKHFHKLVSIRLTSTYLPSPWCNWRHIGQGQGVSIFLCPWLSFHFSPGIVYVLKFFFDHAPRFQLAFSDCFHVRSLLLVIWCLKKSWNSPCPRIRNQSVFTRRRDSPLINLQPGGPGICNKG